MGLYNSVPQVSNLHFSDLESDSGDFTHRFILAPLFTNLDSDTMDGFFRVDYCGHKLVVPQPVQVPKYNVA